MQIWKTYSGGEAECGGLSTFNYRGGDGVCTGLRCKQVGFLDEWCLLRNINTFRR